MWTVDFGWLWCISVGSSVVTNVPPKMVLVINSCVCVCVCFPTPRSTALDTSWVPYNSTQFWHYLPGDGVRSHRLRAQSYKIIPLPPLSMPITTPGCHLCFWPTGYRSELPMTSSLGSINFELRKPVYSLDHWFVMKGCKSGTVRWKSCIGLDMGKGGVAPMLSLSAPLSTCLPTWKLSEPCSFWVFVEASLQRLAWLTHWPLVDWFNLQPLSPPWRSGGWERKFQPSNHKDGSPDNQSHP